MKESSFSGKVKGRWRVFLCGCSILLLLLVWGPSNAGAHDAASSLEFSNFMLQQFQHEDADPWKGLLSLTVTNTGTQPWGDFHFQIYQVPGYGAVSNVHFDVTDPNQPMSSQSGLTWSVDNVTVGAILDLYFYSDPVMPGKTATFTVYTDNTTDKVSFFGIQLYPTPVPIPGAVWLLGSALLGLAGLRKRFPA